jgi:hypothetical protein
MTAVMQSITDCKTAALPTSGAGVVSNSAFTITPSALLAAARLAGYQSLADEIRLDHIKFTLSPVYGNNAAGRMCLYIERDSAAAIVGTVNAAMDQRELSSGGLKDKLSITWRPQEPLDHEFNLLNPGTVSLGKFCIIGENLADGAGVAIPNATVIYTIKVDLRFTIRGRP